MFRIDRYRLLTLQAKVGNTEVQKYRSDFVHIRADENLNQTVNSLRDLSSKSTRNSPHTSHKS